MCSPRQILVSWMWEWESQYSSSLMRHYGALSYHLSHLFRIETGIGYRKYLSTTRLDRAQSLLLDPTLSVKEVAASVGYSTTATFDREFKRVHKCSPSEWRRRY